MIKQTSLLTTKINIPVPRQGIISRSHLVSKLNSGLNGKLILVSAPAGFGKTTLISEWSAQCQIPICWFSVDERDGELERFLSYIVASLQSIQIKFDEPDFNHSTLNQTNDPISILISIINQIEENGKEICLVLDDYHLIQSQEIHEALTYMLENLPSKMRLVIVTRIDPPLRLAKLRSQGELCEIRVDDLRFTSEEAVRFLNQSMNLGLSADDIATLTKKTEGWIVGLQLAGFSLLMNPDKHNFVITFAGDDRYIADYLLDEVLTHQPEHIQNFLLQTSILERLCASLCDSVIEINNSQAILNDLEKANLFLVPLDNQRNWYRYHHLFVDLLQQRISQILSNDQITELHKRASTWFSSNDLLFEALSHAIAADDMIHVVLLIEGNLFTLLDQGEILTLMRWLERIPHELRRDRPWLWIAQAWTYIYVGKLEAGAHALQSAEEGVAYLSRRDISRAMGHIYTIKAYRSWLQGEGKTAESNARKALEILPGDELSVRAFASMCLGAALIQYSDLKKASKHLQKAITWAMDARNDHVYILASGNLAYLLILQGELHHAEKVCRNVIQQIQQRLIGESPATSQIFEMMSNISISKNNLDQALQFAEQGLEISKSWGHFDSLIMGCIYLITPLIGQRKFIEARKILALVNKPDMHESPWFKNIIGKAEMEISLATGDIRAASQWAKESGLDYRDKVLQTNRTTYRSFVRILMVEGKYAEASHLLGNLIEDSVNSGAYGYLYSLLPMQSIVQAGMGNQEQALSTLKRALTMAASGGYIWEYVRQGEAMAELLRMAIQRSVQSEYATKLLVEIEKDQAREFEDGKSRFTEVLEDKGLIDPLSQREIEVLAHIAEGYTNQEIAQELVLSLYTVKSHARNIFSKLGVKNRTEAVAKAQMFGLLPQNKIPVH